MTEKRGDITGHSEGMSPASGGRPEWLRQRLEWFMDLRFGLFVHWGPYSQWDCCESWPLVPADTWARPDHLKCWNERGRDLERFTRDYWGLNRTFNPTRFDPDAWAALAQDAGMRYITFTTKHHDGFCMFDTRTTQYRTTHPDCPFHQDPRADIARQVFAAFRRQGLAISCYFSKSDWHSPWYWSPEAPVVDRNPNYDTCQNPERWAKFVGYAHRQVEELMTGYGPIDVLWLDGGQVRPPDQDLRMDALAAMARRHQPGLIIADRTVGGQYEDIITPEQEIPEQPLAMPWESCLTLGNAWKYVPEDQYKSPGIVVHMLAETAAKGGNLLLGVGPDAQGVIPPPAQERLRQVGRWLRTNGEAIYHTRPVPPYASGAVRFTARAPYTYAIVLERGDETAGPREIRIQGLCPEPGSAVEVLGAPGAVSWQEEGEGFRAVVPQGAAGAPAWVLRFRRGG